MAPAARRRSNLPPEPKDTEDRMMDERLAQLERNQETLQGQLAQLIGLLNPTVAAPQVPTAEPPSQVSQEIREALRRLPEPRRQRKERNLAPRKKYRLKRTLSTVALRDLQGLTPAASSIVMYLAQHPGASLPDISVSLDLRKKTVANLLSVLRAKDLLDDTE